jgi:long-chain acyl-CoA synthetase
VTTPPTSAALADFRVDGALGFWEIAAVRPDRVAVVAADGAETTFGELRARADAVAAGLIGLGLSAGDTVALVMANEPAFLTVQLATSQIGMYLTPVNRHLTALEIAYILDNSDAAVLVTAGVPVALVAEAADLAGLPPERRFAVGCAPGFRDFGELAGPAATGSSPASFSRRVGDTMLYSSGTTGRPKGVRRALRDMTPEQSLSRGLPLMRARYGMPPGPGTHLVVAPLYHAAPNGFALMALHLGQTLVLMDKWDAEQALALVQRYGVTSTHMVPTMFHRLLALPHSVRNSCDLSSLEYVVHAGAPCPVLDKQRMLEWWGPIIFEYYSSTEGGGTAVGPQDWLRHPGTVGRAWPDAEVRILDGAGDEVPAGTVGGVYFHNDTVFEYHKDPEKTAAARHGVFYTAGDLGHLDQDGWLFLSDRRGDLIISGGVNIYPAEVEEALLSHPAVADVGVIGLPDPEWGATVHAVVQPTEDAVAGDDLADEILRFCADRLARFKRPRTLEFRPVPRTLTGKLSRSALRRAVLGEGTDR